MNYQKLITHRDTNNPFAKLLGIKTLEIEKGYARGEMVLKEEYQNIVQSVHGGCIFTLADTIGGTAAASHGTYMTTVSGNLNYLSPALNSKKLVATAKEVKHGKRICVYTIDIQDDKGTLLAQGNFSYYNLNKPIPLE